MYRRYSDRVDIYAIYIREAHPVDGWRTPDNEEAGIRVATAQRFDQRAAAASLCCEALRMPIPLLVDGIDDAVATAYSGFPDRLYVIDREGRVAYKGARGPFGFEPREAEQALLLLLADEAKRFAAKDEDPKDSAAKDSAAKDSAAKDNAAKDSGTKDSGTKKREAKGSETKSSETEDEEANSVDMPPAKQSAAKKSEDD